MPQLFEIVNQAEETWTVPHLTCGGNIMLPGHNPHTLAPPVWWWYCMTCDRFVRPLSRHEWSVLNQAVAAGKKPTKRRLSKQPKR